MSRDCIATSERSSSRCHICFDEGFDFESDSDSIGEHIFSDAGLQKLVEIERRRSLAGLADARMFGRVRR